MPGLRYVPGKESNQSSPADSPSQGESAPYWMYPPGDGDWLHRAGFPVLKPAGTAQKGRRVVIERTTGLFDLGRAAAVKDRTGILSYSRAGCDRRSVSRASPVMGVRGMSGMKARAIAPARNGLRFPGAIPRRFFGFFLIAQKETRPQAESPVLSPRLVYE